MHISVADFEQVVEEKGTSQTKYVNYHIHINGVYHCSSRYSQLQKLHEALKRKYGAGCLENFPPKHFFYLKPEDCAERRWGLQKWFQKIAQQPHIVTGDIFQSFLLNAQKEVKQGPEKDTSMDIYLPNGKKVTVDIVTTDQTEDVLETVCSVIELDPQLTYYFGLFLVDDLDGKVIIRRLQDFESPFISLLRAEPHQKVQLRKAYWDISQEPKLWSNPVALNLMYIETIADIKNGAIRPNDQDTDTLASLRQARDRKGFLEVARKQPGYGYETLGTCTANWPHDNTSATMSISSYDILLVTEDGEKHSFPIPRIRCWRTYSVEKDVELEFEFYADSKEGPKMTWVKIISTFNIHAAMCLQFVVEEKIRLRDKKPIKVPSDREGSFKPRRQTNKPTDMSFLTSEGTGADTEENSEESSEAPQALKIKVKLSELKEKVKSNTDSENTESNVMRTIDEVFDASLDLGEDDEDDHTANYAALSGLSSLY